MGVLYASLGRVSDAMDVDRWLASQELPYQAGQVTAWRAGITARLGDKVRATAQLEQARQEGMFWQRLHARFHLHESLGDHAPFVQLMGPAG